jgi:hypothetical protein
MASTVGSGRPAVPDRRPPVRLAVSVVVDRVGTPLGRFRGVTPDGEWAVVESGVVFRRSTLVPIDGCRSDGDRLVVSWSVSTVSSAPRLKPHDRRPVADDLRARLLDLYDR